jgi:hypothetical protein
MNYADFGLELAQKTGMFDVVRAMESLAKVGSEISNECQH